MKKFLESWDSKLFYQITKEINRYLNAGGYVMKITTKGPNQNGKLEFDIDIF